MAIGAQMQLYTRHTTQLREIYAGSGFASSESPWPTFGMGKDHKGMLKVKWPSGLEEQFKIRSKRVIDIYEGHGISLKKNHENHENHEEHEEHEEHEGHDHEEPELKFTTAEMEEFSITLAKATTGIINQTLDLTGEIIVAPENLYHETFAQRGKYSSLNP
jgi:hypothetical protein